MSNTHILFITGETSGDYHSSILTQHLFQIQPNIKISAFASKNMHSKGASIVHDPCHSSTIGILSSFLQIPNAISTTFKLSQFLKKNHPNLFVLVDHQGLNLFLIRFIRFFSNAPIIYFFPPNVSLWGQWNIKKLVQNVQLIISPFLQDCLQYQRYSSQYPQFKTQILHSVHPLFESLSPFLPFLHPPKKYPQNTKPIIGLFPGSRQSEIQKLLPILLQSASLLQYQFHASFLIPVANTQFIPLIHSILKKFPHLNCSLIKHADYPSYQLCHAAIATSGSVLLELALLLIPCVSVYITDPLSYLIAKYILKIKTISLPNILLNQNIIPEKIQKSCQPIPISNQISKILLDHSYRNSITSQFKTLIPILSSGLNLHQCAQIILKLLKP